MGRISFDSSGKLSSVDGSDIIKEKNKRSRDIVEKELPVWKESPVFKLQDNEKIERVGWGNRSIKKQDLYPYDYKKHYDSDHIEDLEDDELIDTVLKTSETLEFLKKDKVKNKHDASKYDFWSFYSDGKLLEPLLFSNGKTQEDIVKETVGLIKKGQKIIFIKGVCGSGKSAIALNIARLIGKASIVVPLKTLQNQYEEDYTGKKYILKPNGERLLIASITGKDNHDSIISPGVSCADETLPENIKITEKNMNRLIELIEKNPLNDNIDTMDIEIKDIKRLKIAPTNPYWSPILPADFEIKNLHDAKKLKYKGVNSREYIFYHRKSGCSYYDQYLGYVHADVIIFNSAKYTAELSIGRKPETEVEIIDEADEFLDRLFDEKEINLNRLQQALSSIEIENVVANKAKIRLIGLIEEILEESKDRSDIDEVIRLDETNIGEILMTLLKNPDLEAEISLDEQNYANRVIEISKIFEEYLEYVYVSFRKDKDNLIIGMVSSNLSGKIKEIIDKNKSLVFMSGTLHSENVIRNILGITDFKIIEAETMNQGGIDIIRTGKEFNCQYSSFSSQDYSREDYLHSTSVCIKKAKLPLLVHVNAYNDLPNESELEKSNITNIISSESLLKIQSADKKGNNIMRFKEGVTKTLFTTKCSRGIDFPGEKCNSIVFTKYPNPNINDSFWKILKKTHPKDFWSFYKDKAKRELLQKIYRAIRSTNDHVYVLSPDIRVIEAVQEMQKEMHKEKNKIL